MVYVQDINGKPMMPTTRHGKVRRLLKDKKAVVVNLCPFTIKLMYVTSDYKQEIVLGVDAGTKHVGLSATTKSKELYSSEVILRNDIVDLLSTRRELRKARRNRLRYRKPRFDNRVKSKRLGWIAPSVKYKVDAHIRVVENVCSILPISRIVIEVAQFDTQKIKNPEISGKEYQEGDQLEFWNTREYVLARDGHKCQYCKGKSKDSILNVHHIESRKTGGDSPSNLITLCETCHKEYHKGVVKLPKQFSFTTRTNKQNIQQLRFIPKNGYIVLEIVYNKKEKNLMLDNGNYLGIDIGLDNLASCVSNTGSCFIINGRPLKSINQYYNKRLAFLKSKLKDNKQISKQIRILTNKRNNKIKDYLHKASRILVNHVVSNGINTIIIGHNKCWKQEINIGKRNNQNFVSIPFNMFISMISYKATLEGINVKIVEESYTSKCSFLDNERICKHESYKGRRTKRGLFKTSFGKTINADINGAFNIIRKSEKESFDVTMLPKGRGFWWNPVRISV